jgi:tagaturonate epimerase
MEKKMSLQELIELLTRDDNKSNKLVQINISESKTIQVYPLSVNEIEGGLICIGKIGFEKFLFVFLSKNSQNPLWNKFNGEEISLGKDSDSVKLKECKLIHENAIVIKQEFDFTRSKPLGVVDSIGMGDRLGLANPGHIRALKGFAFKPILAQQSIRELTRTQRTPDEVMDAAVWAVLQEGYKDGFGSDADHLKTKEDIDYLMKAGFTMYTFDPSAFVKNEADTLDVAGLDTIIPTLNWATLNTTADNLINSYSGKTFVISKELSITPQEVEVKRALVKYGNSVAHIKELYNHIITNYSKNEFEVEVSVDETDSVTSPFEHFFIASELIRLNVKFISLAPRFIGDFEKGIDYKGDINLFREEYIKHLSITKYFGTYKISLHSGSDKFAVYHVIGSLRDAHTHVKTAGTSYLEALRVVALCEFNLFREILDFACSLYETEKLSYHVTANLTKVKKGSEYSDSELVGLFESTDVRQILHVTFGKTLSDRKPDGSYLFKERIVDCLKRNEELHYQVLEKHFRKHLEPFQNK